MSWVGGRALAGGNSPSSAEGIGYIRHPPPVRCRFKVHFIVIVFHQTFEGLGLGSRLAFIKLPTSYNYVPVLAAIIYGLSTPVGIAAARGSGCAARTTPAAQPRQSSAAFSIR
ncbi:hypothetical protein DFH08DRAFT_1090035 [Mycena albidolilacea]|uniref:Uncharacterized protein n=1 Tax=Mycena albidolilacea TaxID=1033008 RepID=A0AAD6YYR2_9AGAR|nr:hypothetical protein DFH08DRAFT_1090035 [Mycena albidolilacea]